MKAIRLIGKQQIELQEIPVPEITQNEMLIKVRAASICGTDVRMYQNGHAHASARHPLTLGHEFAGDIVRVGKNVRGYKEGQRVSVAPNFGCGHCIYCIDGNTHMCREMNAFGVTTDGAFAEYVRIPEAAIRQGNISILGESISYEEAALVEPLSCVYNGHFLLHAEKGADYLIIGLGPIGIMHIMTARLFGAGKIYVNDLKPERVKKACELFPEVIPVGNDIPGYFRENGKTGVDVCVIAAPSADAQSASLDYMNMNGKLLFFGGLPKTKEHVSINTNLIHYRQLTIQGCTKQSVSEYHTCTKLVNDKRIPLSFLISDTFPIDRFFEALDLAEKAEGLKHVIVFDQL